MSLKSVVALLDDRLHEVFHRKQPDAKRARARALRTIDTARRQFASSEPMRGRKVWAAANEVVSFTPGFAIAGRDTVFVPAERFGEMLDNLEAAIRAGELDDALLGSETGAAAAAPVVPAVDKPKRTRDPAATARAMATRAANKAAKAS